jgi:G3E family GTPase
MSDPFRPSGKADPLAGKVPVTLITGFLGAGKTTMIGQLVRHPGMDRAAVIINEVGEIGIDNDLVMMSTENVSLLANGCLCCSVRTDLQETLRELFGDRRAGKIPDFDRVIIETTGLADPGPVIQTLISDTMVSAHYRLDGVVTLVDAVNIGDQLERQPEAERQIVMADRIFITKTDLLPEATLIESVRSTLASINPQADLEICHNGMVDPQQLTGLGLRSSRVDESTLRFLGALGPPESETGGLYLAQRLRERHRSNIRSFPIRLESPLSWDAFSAAMEMLINLRGKDLLRVKGIVNVQGKPVVVQGVGHIFHPPVHLDGWPSGDTHSRLVFIARDMDPSRIKALFEAAADLGGPEH